MMLKFHPFHMVMLSPWPILSSFISFQFTSSMILMMHYSFSKFSFLSLMMMIFVSIYWWKTVSEESLNLGEHMFQSIMNLKLGMILFIISEIMFFLSFFWGYFHSAISPSLEIGLSWPPIFIKTFNPMNIPLLNSLILLSSGISITWAHHQILNKNYYTTMSAMILTLTLGIYFTMLQLFEYMQSGFALNDSSYGSSFFMATGFHGLHVIIGSTFIIISFIRLKNLSNSFNHIVGFETSAWYWHFVDVVWLFLYTSIYWWGY